MTNSKSNPPPLQRKAVRDQNAIAAKQSTTTVATPKQPPPSPPPKAKTPKPVKPEKSPLTIQQFRLTLPKRPKARTALPGDPPEIIAAKELLSEVDHHYPDPDPKADWPDEQWLESLAIYGQLPEAKREAFARDAIFYRKIWAERRALVKTAYGAIHIPGESHHHVKVSEFQRRTLEWIILANPERWIICPIDGGGCGGPGVQEDHKCLRCNGFGYAVVTIPDLRKLAKHLERDIAAFEAGAGIV
jgi:hypothetical protein